MRDAFDKDDIVGAIRDFYNANDGDESTTDIILNLGSEILGCSVDTLLEEIHITISHCDLCQYGYEAGFENPEENWHSFCGAGRCYLCEQARGNHCEEFIEGDIPGDKERF